MFKILLLLALASCAKLNFNEMKEKSGKNMIKGPFGDKPRKGSNSVGLDPEFNHASEGKPRRFGDSRSDRESDNRPNRDRESCSIS